MDHISTLFFTSKISVQVFHVCHPLATKLFSASFLSRIFNFRPIRIYQSILVYMMLKMIPVGKKRWRIFTLGRKTNAIRFRSIVTRHLLRNKNRILHMCNTSLWSIYWIRHCSTDKSFANNRLNTELGFKKRHRFQDQRFCVCSACIFEWNGNSGKSHSFNL